MTRVYTRTHIAALLLSGLCLISLPVVGSAATSGVESENGPEPAVAFDVGSLTLGAEAEISWEKPADQDAWVGIFPVDANDRDYDDWEYISSSQSAGTLALDPDDVGEYEVRMFAGSGYERLAVSAGTLTVETEDDDDGGGDDDGSSYAVSVAAGPYVPGEDISISWTTPGAGRAWIGLYPVSASDPNYDDWEYVSRETSDGTLELAADETGNYEARLFSGNGYDREAVSNTFEVTTQDDGDDDNDDDPGTGDYTLAADADSYVVGEEVMINWELPASAVGETHWVALYEAGANNSSYLDWEYIDDDDPSGSVRFETGASGEYEARLFRGNGYDLVDNTDTFTVTTDKDDDDEEPSGYELALSVSEINAGEAVAVSWEAPADADRDDDWIGLYQSGDTNQEYVDWEYIDEDDTSGTLVFVIDEPGSYEFRYLKNDGFSDVVTSPLFMVGDDDGDDDQCPVADLDAIANIPPPDGPIIAFGDSLTAGVGATDGQDYVSELERELNVSITNAGVSGDTTEEALARLEADVLSEDPSVVIIWLGGNDIIGRFYERVEDGLEDLSFNQLFMLISMKLTGKIPDPAGISEDETFDNLETIIERIQDTGAATIVVGFSGGIYDEDLEDRYAAVAAATDSLYVPDALDNVIGRPSRMSDLVHPNNEGYEIVAARVAPYLQCTL